MWMLTAQFEKCIKITVCASIYKSINFLQRRCLWPYRLDFIHHSDAFEDSYFSLAVVEDYLIIRLADGRINRHHDGSDLCDSHIENVPFRTVVADDSYFILLLNAEFNQSATHDIGKLNILVDAILSPTAIDFRGKRHFLVRMALFIMRQEVKNSLNILHFQYFSIKIHSFSNLQIYGYFFDSQEKFTDTTRKSPDIHSLSRRDTAGYHNVCNAWRNQPWC